MRIFLCITLALFFGGSTGAPAFGDSVVYDNGARGGAPGSYLSSGDYPLADDFTLTPGETTISHVTWWGSYFDFVPAVDQLGMAIYSDDSGVPQVGQEVFYSDLIDLTRTDTGETVPGLGTLPMFQFDAEFQALTLNANQTYWISLFDNNGADHIWATTETILGNPSAYYFRGIDPAEWRSSSSDRGLAFQLAVPEPGTLALLATGCMLVIRRRKFI